MALKGRGLPNVTVLSRNRSFQPSNVFPVGIALENTAQALAITRSKVKAIAQATTVVTTAPTPTKATRFKVIGLANETDAAKSPRRSLLGIANEACFATALSFTQVYFFTPPAQKLRMQPDPPYDRLWDWYSIDVGSSILKIDGQYVQFPYPTQDQVNAATVAYIGGHIYQIGKTEAQALTAAGYANFISTPGQRPPIAIGTANAHVSAGVVNKGTTFALGTALEFDAIAGGARKSKRRTVLMSTVTTSGQAVGVVHAPGGGPNLALGFTSTSNEPWDTNATNGTMATNIHNALTWGNQHTFNFGGNIGEARDTGLPASPSAADQWVRSFGLVDQRISNFGTCTLPHKIMTLYAAPTTITGLGDYDYSVAAPLSGNRAALARWAVEVVGRYLAQGVTHFQFYNELKGYGSFAAYLADYNAIFDAVKANGSTSAALLGGPYEIWSQRQTGWGPSEVQGSWGAVLQSIVDDYKNFLANAHGYDFIAVDLSAGDQSGDITGNYNPNGLPFSTMVQYFNAVASWLDTHVAGSKAVIAAEIYGWSGTNADQFQQAVTTWAGGFATGRQTTILLWNENDGIAGRVVDKATSNLATIGQRMVSMRNAGLAQ